jgi:hypothetical protein
MVFRRLFTLSATRKPCLLLDERLAPASPWSNHWQEPALILQSERRNIATFVNAEVYEQHD